jgi:hypothetical protein
MKKANKRSAVFVDTPRNEFRFLQQRQRQRNSNINNAALFCVRMFSCEGGGETGLPTHQNCNVADVR